MLAVRDRVFEQFIESGKDGFLVEKDEQIFNAHLDMLLRDENLGAKMGRNARVKAEQFSLDEIAKKFENLYKQIR